MKLNTKLKIAKIEKTQPKIFHIHIDAQDMSKSMYEEVTSSLNFLDTDFDGHPEGYQHFEPDRHLTLKLFSKEEFEDTWKSLVDITNASEFKGYLEGEYIPFDDFIPYKTFQDQPIPFVISRRKLSSEEKFRQTEIHITFHKDESHPDLIKKLLEMGFYGAYIPKKDGLFIVLTIQGKIKEISKMYPIIKEWLQRSGGAYRCTIKEERAIKYKTFGVSCEDMPEVIDQVTYF